MGPTEREDTMLLTLLLREAENDARNHHCCGRQRMMLRNYEVMIACVYDYGWIRYPFLHFFGQTYFVRVEL